MGLTVVIIVNAVLSALVLGAIVGSHLWAIIASDDTSAAAVAPAPAHSPISSGPPAGIPALVSGVLSA
jgi:hypothetical protein